MQSQSIRQLRNVSGDAVIFDKHHDGPGQPAQTTSGKNQQLLGEDAIEASNSVADMDLQSPGTTINGLPNVATNVGSTSGLQKTPATRSTESSSSGPEHDVNVFAPHTEDSDGEEEQDLLHELFDLLDESRNDILTASEIEHTLSYYGLKALAPALFKPFADSELDDGIPRQSFIDKLATNMDVKKIVAAFHNNLVIPKFRQFCETMVELYDEVAPNDFGNNSDRVPSLVRADDYWGMSICTVDGQQFTYGDGNVPFTVQECALPLLYASALEEHGLDSVHSRVGVEPSADDKYSFKLLNRNQPYNPMNIAGGILTCSMVQDTKPPDERFRVVDNVFRHMAGNGGHISFDNSTFLSEKNVGDKCYALGYNMRSAGSFASNVQAKDVPDIVDFFFQTQSIEVDCESLAIMAGTLANGGVCPLTHQPVISPEATKNTLCLMFTAGMNDYSGQWGFQVGLPAKGSSCGAIMVVVPNVMGLCVYSPRLDPRTQASVRGTEFCQKLTRRFNFHIFDQLVSGVSTKKQNPGDSSDNQQVVPSPLASPPSGKRKMSFAQRPQSRTVRYGTPVEDDDDADSSHGDAGDAGAQSSSTHSASRSRNVQLRHESPLDSPKVPGSNFDNMEPLYLEETPKESTQRTMTSSASASSTTSIGSTTSTGKKRRPKKQNSGASGKTTTRSSVHDTHRQQDNVAKKPPKGTSTTTTTTSKARKQSGTTSSSTNSSSSTLASKSQQATSPNETVTEIPSAKRNLEDSMLPEIPSSRR